MSPELRRYLDLEQAMVELDAGGNPAADVIRDLMDGAWQELSADARLWINARDLPPLGSELRVAVGAGLFVRPPERAPDPTNRWTFDDWRSRAA